MPPPSRRTLLALCAGAGFIATFGLLVGSTIHASFEANPRALPQRVPLEVLTPEFAPRRLARATFQAPYAGLGAMVLPTSTCGSDLALGVRIRLREQGAPGWTLDRARHRWVTGTCDSLSVFSFPALAASQGRTYELEMEGGGTTALVAWYHVQEITPSASLISQSRFLAVRTLRFLGLLSRVEVVGALLFAAAAALVLLFVPTGADHAAGVPRRAWGAVAFGTTLLGAGLFSTLGVDAHHDGIMLKPALDVASGQMLFRDSFSQYGALTTLLQAGAVKALGPSLLAIRLLTAFTYGGIAVLLYVLLSRLLRPGVTLAVLGIWILTAPYFTISTLPWSSVYALFFQLLAVWLLLGGRYAAAGVATACTFWCRQPVGVLLAVAVGATWMLLLLRGQCTAHALRTRALRALGGVTAASLPFVVWLTVNDALGAWWTQSIRLAAHWERAYGGGAGWPQHLVNILSNLVPAAAPLDHVAFLGALSWWSLLPVAALIVLVRHTLERPSADVLLLCVVGLASWAQYHPLADAPHFYWASTPMYGLLALLLFQVAARFVPRAPAAVTIIALLALSAPETTRRIAQGAEWWRGHQVMIDEPTVLAGLRLTAEEAEFHQRFARTLAEVSAAAPAANVISMGPDALYLTYGARARNVGNMYVNWGPLSEIVAPGFSERRAAYIAQQRPIVIVDRWPATEPPGYCRAGTWTRNDPAFITVPCP